jgi:hypothetical protein
LLILDTGPIRELVLFHAVHRFRFETLRSELRLIANLESYDRCVNFIGSFRSKTTSASVVVELNNWIRQTESTGQEKLWNRVYDEFKGMGMNEEVVKLLDMNFAMVKDLGPVDVSLIKIAERQAGRNPLVLTIDDKLRGKCEGAGILVRHLRELSHMTR